MSTLQKPVKQAQRRLWLNRWLTTLGWSFTIAATLFILAVVIERIWIVSPNAGKWIAILAGSLTAAATIASVIWSAATRDTFAVAAVKLDQAAGLKERLSTGLYCEKSTDPFARAVVTDAERITHGITVHRHLPVQFPRSANYASGTLIAALLFVWLFPTVDLAGKQDQREEEIQKKTRAERTQAMMRPVIEQELKKITDKNPALKKEVENLDPLKEAKLETPQDVRQQMIKKVEKLTDKLDEKRNSTDFGKVDEFKKMMRRLAEQQQKNDSPVGALSKSLSHGDFKSAQDAIENIKAELAKAPKTPEDEKKVEEMKEQLKQLSEKINQLAQDQKKTQDELAKSGLSEQDIKKALENMQKKDFDALAKQLAQKGLSQQQVDKLVQQMQKRSEASNAASKMGQNMAQAAKGSKGGNQGQLSQQAQQGLSAAGEQLGQMESLQQELNQLNVSKADLDEMKEHMGQGCSQCKGTGMQNGKPCSGCKGTGIMQKEGKFGMGNLGIGQGGIAQRQQADTKMVQKRAPVNTLPGAIISQQFIDGEQFKGDVSDAFKDAAIAAQRDVTDNIAREQIPRALQDPVRKYFTRSFGDATETKPVESKSP